mmetsp:Transcript_30135/g.90226  ORF Transcript_30135/g.90226 Transcript_30135/m.90226 type:complete len:308 (+) Transcript_30135:1019-1942(+)
MRRVADRVRLDLRASQRGGLRGGRRVLLQRPPRGNCRKVRSRGRRRGVGRRDCRLRRGRYGEGQSAFNHPKDGRRLPLRDDGPRRLFVPSGRLKRGPRALRDGRGPGRPLPRCLRGRAARGRRRAAARRRLPAGRRRRRAPRGRAPAIVVPRDRRARGRRPALPPVERRGRRRVPRRRGRVSAALRRPRRQARRAGRRDRRRRRDAPAVQGRRDVRRQGPRVRRRAPRRRARREPRGGRRPRGVRRRRDTCDACVGVHRPQRGFDALAARWRVRRDRGGETCAEAAAGPLVGTRRCARPLERRGGRR